MVKPWLVRETQFAQRISAEDMAIFRRICPDRRYRPGEALFRAGDPATDLHVVAQGQLKLVATLEDGRERIVALCGAGDFVGESFLTEAAYHQVEAVALTEVLTCPVSRRQFMQLALNAPALVLTFAQILAARLHDCREHLGAAYAPVKARLLQVLLGQAERFGSPAADGWLELSTPLKHEELAALVSATRVSVSMAMAELREEGLLEGTRGRYRLSPELLKPDSER